jgi:hypothetical protein
MTRPLSHYPERSLACLTPVSLTEERIQYCMELHGNITLKLMKILCGFLSFDVTVSYLAGPISSNFSLLWKVDDPRRSATKLTIQYDQSEQMTLLCENTQAADSIAHTYLLYTQLVGSWE